MNEDFQKELDKNYLKVQKKEIKVRESADKHMDKYNKRIKELGSILKEENKLQKEVDKKIKDDQKVTIKEIKDDFKEKTNLLTDKVKDVSKKNKEELEKADAKHLKETTKLNGLIEKENNSHNKENEKVLKQYEKDVSDNNGDIEKIEEDFQHSSAKLQEKYDDKKTKYDEKVVALNEKRDSKIFKLNETSAKKIEKLNKDIESQRGKSDKQIGAFVPIYEEKMGEINDLVTEEIQEHETKSGNITSTLDSKVSRRNKFLEKAENENDSKAAKQQRKEIKQLQQNADREIKILAKAHEDRNKDLTAMKRELNRNNLEQIAAVEREFTNYKEDSLMQIELNKVALSDDITNAKLNTDLKLQDELSKFNEFELKHTDNVADVVMGKDLEIKGKENDLAKLEVEFDKINEINVSKLEDEIVQKEKELKIADITKDSEYSLSNNTLAVKVSKLNAEKQILVDHNELDMIIAERTALNLYHRNDYDKQASIKNEFYNSQESLKVTMQDRAQELLDYEELEVENRSNLKVKFLEEQRARLDEEYKNLVERVENSYNKEKNFFDKEIEALASNDKAALTEFINEKEEQIQDKVDEKKELDPQADKRRIKELSEKIDLMKSELSEEIRQKEDAINVKIALYQDNLELATKRYNLALEQAKELYSLENGDLNYAVELVNQNKEAELQEAKARHTKTIANTNNYMNLSTGRNTVSTEEHTKYLTDREDKENRVMEESKMSFENNKNTITNEKDANLSNLESEKSEMIERIKQESLTEEEKLEGLLVDVTAKIAQSETKATSRLNEHAATLATSNREIEGAYKQVLATTANELKIREKRYEDIVVQIDKKADVEKKTYEAEKSRVQKEYDIELKKSIVNINSRLEADIKAL